MNAKGCVRMCTHVYGTAGMDPGAGGAQEGEKRVAAGHRGGVVGWSKGNYSSPRVSPAGRGNSECKGDRKSYYGGVGTSRHRSVIGASISAQSRRFVAGAAT